MIQVTSLLPFPVRFGTTERTDIRTGDKLKILVAIASYGSKNERFLARVIDEYRSMSHDVRIVVLSNIPRDLGAGVEVKVGLPTPDPWSLPFGHKAIFAESASQYDLFIYSEDDVLITEKNIEGFLAATETLPPEIIPGFVRYETGSQGEMYFDPLCSHFHWEPGSVNSIGKYTFAFYTNEHSACYVLTREQLRRAIASGGFLVQPHEGRYDLLCAAATDPYTRCGMKKVVCLSHLDQFTVHHLPNIKHGTRPYRASSVFHRQIEALLDAQDKETPKNLLFDPETKVLHAKWSKDYYEPVDNEVVALVPSHAQNVLSIGCAWSSTEEELIKRGHRVVGIPVDSVIAACAADKGVEVVYGGFEEARRKLEGHHFDCILLINVLHLLPDPVAVLSLFSHLLDRGGCVITAAPNFGSVLTYWRRLTGDRFHKDLKSFEKSGIQFTSRRTLRRWLQQCNMNMTSSCERLPERLLGIRRFLPRWVRNLVASELVVFSTKN